MKKRIKWILIGCLSLIIVIFIIFNISVENFEIAQNEHTKNDIEPAEEIEETISPETTIKLFFPDKNSGVLSEEERKVEAKDLIENPYMYVINLLIKGPTSTNLSKIIPDGTKVNKAYLEKNTLHVDLSQEFLNGGGMESIYSIVNSLYEFNEVNDIKFTIDGKEQDGLKEKFIKK